MRNGGRNGDETGRVDALRRYQILDTPADSVFDTITSLAATLLKAPIALTSLVDSDRIWFKSRIGVDLLQTGRESGLCSSVILSDGPYVVSDAAMDPRTSCNPLVSGDFGFRFYAAAPLRTHDGYNIGALCVVDHEPRQLAAGDLDILQRLAGLVMECVEARYMARKHDETVSALESRIDELEKLHEARDRHAVKLAHDLRNSLGSSSLMTKLLMEEKTGPLNQRQRQMVESIGATGDDMLVRVKRGLEPGEGPRETDGGLLIREPAVP